MSQAIEIGTRGLLRMADCGLLEAKGDCPVQPTHLTDEETWLEQAWVSGSGQGERVSGRWCWRHLRDIASVPGPPLVPPITAAVGTGSRWL